MLSTSFVFSQNKPKNDSTEICFPYQVGQKILLELNECDKNKELLKKTLDMYDNVYKTEGAFNDYIAGITDELFFSAVCGNNVVDLGGSLNHCCMGEQFMNIKLIDDKLFGKNSFEIEYNPIAFLHCDIPRRNPAKDYDKDINTKIKQIFNI